MMGRSQRYAILEWGLVNPEKISVFLQRMKVDQKFRIYYYMLYDSLRLLYRKIYDVQQQKCIYSTHKFMMYSNRVHVEVFYKLYQLFRVQCISDSHLIPYALTHHVFP